MESNELWMKFHIGWNPVGFFQQSFAGLEALALKIAWPGPRPLWVAQRTTATTPTRHGWDGWDGWDCWDLGCLGAVPTRSGRARNGWSFKLQYLPVIHVRISPWLVQNHGFTPDLWLQGKSGSRIAWNGVLSLRQSHNASDSHGGLELHKRTQSLQVATRSVVRVTEKAIVP